MIKTASILLTALWLSTSAGSTLAQNAPQRLQVPTRIQPVEEAQPTIRREALELAEEPSEEPPRNYATVCRDIDSLAVGEFSITLYCGHADEYGISAYRLSPGSYDRESPQETSARWYATQFIQAAQIAAENPDIDLRMSILQVPPYGPYPDSFRLIYRD
jgi:hypothetical protein